MRRPDSEHCALVEALQFQERLRRGELYRCSACGADWYLDPRQKVMAAVPKGRMDRLREWNREPIRLSRELQSKLRSIGASPPYYGYGTEYRETPCTVITTSGERIELALYSPQDSAPIQDWCDCRLGSEIAGVEESPYALPLEIRVASAQASEIAMGFAPTIIEMPNGDAFTLNGPSNFLVFPGHEAAQAKLSRRSFERSNHPPILDPPEEVTCFIADPAESLFSTVLGRF